jgi:hypothetical protein
LRVNLPKRLKQNAQLQSLRATSQKSLLDSTAVYVSSSSKLLEIIFQVEHPNIGGNQKFEKTRA